MAKGDALFDERKSEGNALIKAKDYENAIRYYTEALKIPASKLEKGTRDEKRGAAFSNRSLAYLRLSAKAPSAKFLLKAVEDAQETIKCRPLWAKAHFRMGESLRHLGKNKEATECFLKAYMLDPKDKDLQGYLTRTSKLAELENSTAHLSYKLPQQCAIAGAGFVFLLACIDYYYGAKALPNILLRLFSIIAAGIVGGIVGFLWRMQRGIDRDEKLKPPMLVQLEEIRAEQERVQQQEVDQQEEAAATVSAGASEGYRKKVRSQNKSKRNRGGVVLPPPPKLGSKKGAAKKGAARKPK